MRQKMARTPHLCRTMIPILALAFGAGVALTAAKEPGRVSFGCDAPPGHMCFFTLIGESGGRRTTFAIEGGRREEKGGVVPGADIYMVTIDRPAPSYPEYCRPELPCKAALVTPG